MLRTTEGGALERQQISIFLRRTFTASVVLLGLVVLSVLAMDVARMRTSFWTNHAREVARLTREALLQLGDRDAAYGNVRLSHDGSALDAASATEALVARLDSIVVLTAENPAQNGRARRARRAESVIEATPAGARSRQVDALRDTGQVDELRTTLGEFLRVEDGLYRSRLAQDERWNFAAPLVVLAEVVLLLLGLLGLRRRLLSQTHAVILHREEAVLRGEMLLQQNEELRAQTEQLAEQAIELEEKQLELEEALTVARQEQERFRSLVTSMRDEVYTLDTEQRVTEFFPADVAHLHASPASIVGRAPAERYDSEIAGLHTRAGAAALRGETTSFHWSETTGNVPKAWSTVLSPMRDAGGSIVGAVGVTRDVTDEERQREVLDETQARLRQAQKLEAIGQLAGGVAHDFNNLLSVIVSYAWMLESDLAEGSPEQEAVHAIQNSAMRAAELTKQLLTFSRKQVVETTMLDLNAAVEDVTQLLPRLVGADVSVDVSLAEQALAVMADGGQVGQILMNIATNANAAMPNGGTLRVETALVECDDAFVARHVGTARGPHARLRITDSGQGMSEATLSHIFEPFFTTKPVGEGTGLGLATVYGIVKQWQGCIDVTSRVGEGTSFDIYLPLLEVEPGALQPRPQSPRAAVAGALAAMDAATADAAGANAADMDGSPGRGATVLLVDDDDAVRTCARVILVKAGFVVLEASSGIAALRLLEESTARIDIVLSDMVMPGMGGRELAYEVRVRYPDARLVLMSGYTSDALSADDPLRHGSVFVDKPFTPASLLGATREALATWTGEARDPRALPVKVSAENDRRAIDALVNGIDAVVWECDATTGRFHYVSRRAESLLGYPRHQWHADGFWNSIVHPDDRQRVVELRQAAYATETSFTAEYRLLSAAGATIWVRDLVRVSPKARGAGAQLRGVMLDITETKVTEQSLRASELRLEAERSFLNAVLENLTDAVAAFDENGRMTLANPSMRELLGSDAATYRAPAELPAYRVFHPDGRTPVARDELPSTRALRGESPRQVELVVAVEGGGRRTVSACARSIRDASGASVGAVVTVQDVTETKLAIEELRRAKERAESADRAKSQFLSLVSHELHTPLNAVIGFADVLRRNRPGHLNDKELQYAERIAANGRHLLSIVRNVIDLTSLQAGALTLERAPIDLGDLVREALAAHREEAERRGLAVMALMPPVLRPVMGDVVRLRQVLDNLLENALMFTSAGSIALRVVAKADGTTPARIEVTDTGEGIAADKLEEVFRPFYQDEEFSRRFHGGAGMGLGIARGLCERMGFRLSLASEVGVGTTCVIHLDPRPDLIVGSGREATDA